MSDGSQSPVDHPLRPLRTEERELLRALLSRVWPAQEIDMRLAQLVVRQMSDGGMGSIRVVHTASAMRRFAREIVAANYIDEDGTPVDITVNLDQEGDLFEIDFWKVNFSPLLRYPSPHDLKLRDPARHSAQAAVAS